MPFAVAPAPVFPQLGGTKSKKLVEAAMAAYVAELVAHFREKVLRVVAAMHGTAQPPRDRRDPQRSRVVQIRAL
jgi:hypothetical protein